MGRHTVLTDSLSRPSQIQESERTLQLEVLLELRCQWPVLIDLFATSASRCCSVYFSPFRDPEAMGTDSLLQSWDHLQAYAFPPWAVILPQVIHKLRSSSRAVLTLIAPYWPQGLVPGSAGPSSRPTGNVASSSRPPQPASLLSSSSRSPQASSSYLETLQ